MHLPKRHNGREQQTKRTANTKPRIQKVAGSWRPGVEAIQEVQGIVVKSLDSEVTVPQFKSSSSNHELFDLECLM